MYRAFSLAALLRRRIAARYLGRADAGGLEKSAQDSADVVRIAARLFRKPPEPTPSIPTRIFCGTPGIRQR